MGVFIWKKKFRPPISILWPEIGPKKRFGAEKVRYMQLRPRVVFSSESRKKCVGFYPSIFVMSYFSVCIFLTLINIQQCKKWEQSFCNMWFGPLLWSFASHYSLQICIQCTEYIAASDLRIVQITEVEVILVNSLRISVWTS